MEQYYIPSRRHWIPDQHFSVLIESFNKAQLLEKWQWGNLTQQFSYDNRGRMTQAVFDDIETSYDYTTIRFPVK
jgi:hypothetical protein